MKNEIIRAQQDLFRISTLLQSLWKQLDEFQNCACSPAFDAYLNGVDIKKKTLAFAKILKI